MLKELIPRNAYVLVHLAHIKVRMGRGAGGYIYVCWQLCHCVVDVVYNIIFNRPVSNGVALEPWAGISCIQEVTQCILYIWYDAIV